MSSSRERFKAWWETVDAIPSDEEDFAWLTWQARDAEVEALVEALTHSQNALIDYVERLEKQGEMMRYGRSVIVRNAALLAKHDAKEKPE